MQHIPLILLIREMRKRSLDFSIIAITDRSEVVATISIGDKEQKKYKIIIREVEEKKKRRTDPVKGKEGKNDWMVIEVQRNMGLSTKEITVETKRKIRNAIDQLIKQTEEESNG